MHVHDGGDDECEGVHDGGDECEGVHDGGDEYEGEGVSDGEDEDGLGREGLMICGRYGRLWNRMRMR